MSLDGASDAELVRQFKSGDAAAYDAIVRRFQDRVFRLACVWLYDDQSAQDAAQEVFVRGFKGLRSFRFRSTPFTWLYRTTRNVCNEFNRARRAEPLDDEPLDPSSAPERDVSQFYLVYVIGLAVLALMPLRMVVVEWPVWGAFTDWLATFV